MPVFGPGIFTVGGDDDPITASCLVNSLTISMSKDQADSTTKLCGTVRPGAITYTYSLSGNVDIDSDDAQGLFALSQSAKGQQLPFTFTPETDGTSATGTLIIDPLDFGGEDYGADMTSDFEWALVDAPEYAYPGAPAVESAGAHWWDRLVVKAPDEAAAEETTPAPVSKTSKEKEPVPA